VNYLSRRLRSKARQTSTLFLLATTIDQDSTVTRQSSPPDSAPLKQWLSWLEYLHPTEIELGLDRVRAVAERANLFDDLPTIIIVAGTNGKGSVVAMLSSIYAHAGYRTGAYTSPHLQRFNERIRLDGVSADDELIVQALSTIESCRADVSLTYFEYTTLAAMVVFKSLGVDVAVLEVGLGGRLDAVNIWDASCAVITSVDMDHVDWLGDTREKIGSEKVAVGRSGRPLIVAEPEVTQSIRDAAKTHQMLYWQVNRDYHYSESDKDICVELPDKRLQVPFPSLTGKHQIGNAAAAVVAVESLQQTLPVERSALVQGLQSANVSGRCEQRLYRGIEVVLDVAHNPAAVSALIDTLPAVVSDQEVHAVFAIMADKDLDGVLDIIGDRISHWHLGQLDMPRALETSALAGQIRSRHPDSIISEYSDLASAFFGASDEISETAGKQVILVFGSFFTVSEVLELWD